MIDMTYDLQADAAYMRLSRAPVHATEEAGPFIYDVDGEGRIIGIEILSCSKVLAPGEWKNARRPGPQNADAAE